MEISFRPVTTPPVPSRVFIESLCFSTFSAFFPLLLAGILTCFRVFVGVHSFWRFGSSDWISRDEQSQGFLRVCRSSVVGSFDVFFVTYLANSVKFGKLRVWLDWRICLSELDEFNGVCYFVSNNFGNHHSYECYIYCTNFLRQVTEIWPRFSVISFSISFKNVDFEYWTEKILRFVFYCFVLIHNFYFYSVILFLYFTVTNG